MAQSSSAAHQIASRYAGALIDTAQAANALDSVEKDMNDLSAMLSGSEDLHKLVSSPAYGEGQQSSALMAIASGASFHQLTKNFLSVLIANRRLMILSDMISAFRAEMSRRRGEVKAQVVTATALNDTQARELSDQLKKTLGQQVRLDIKVDPSLLGGMVVTVGSHQVDDSIKTKLERLKQTLTSSNQNTVNLKEVG